MLCWLIQSCFDFLHAWYVYPFPFLHNECCSHSWFSSLIYHWLTICPTSASCTSLKLLLQKPVAVKGTGAVRTRQREGRQELNLCFEEGFKNLDLYRLQKAYILHNIFILIPFPWQHMWLHYSLAVKNLYFIDKVSRLNSSSANSTGSWKGVKRCYSELKSTDSCFLL